MVSVGAVVWEADAETGVPTFVGPEIERLTGYPADALIAGDGWRLIVHHDDLRQARAKLEAAARASSECVVDLRVTRLGGQVIWTRTRLTTVVDLRGHRRIRGVTFEATDQVERERALERRATIDPLTGLLNRAAFEESMRTLRGDDVALLMLDLDGFKQINDRYGHQAGDDVLAQVGAQLASVVRGDEVAARLGGDEFALLIEADACHERAREVVERIRRPLGVPHVPAVGVSVGIARAASGVSMVELMRRADAAMYRAKRSRTGWSEWTAGGMPAPGRASRRRGRRGARLVPVAIAVAVTVPAAAAIVSRAPDRTGPDAAQIQRVVDEAVERVRGRDVRSATRSDSVARDALDELVPALVDLGVERDEVTRIAQRLAQQVARAVAEAVEAVEEDAGVKSEVRPAPDPDSQVGADL